MEKWIKPTSNPPVWRKYMSVYCGGVWERYRQKGHKYLCTQVCTVFPCVRLVCLWRGKVSMGALAPPQTWLLMTSVSQLADWRENIPAPLYPTPSLPSVYPFLHQRTLTNQPSSVGSIAAPVCPGWWEALGEGCYSGLGLWGWWGVMRLDVKNVAHGLLFCVLCARWIGLWQAGVQASQSSLLACVLEKPEGPGLASWNKTDR